MKMRRVWLVQLSSEPFNPTTERADTDNAKWSQTVIADTAREAIALAEKSAKVQSEEAAQPMRRPFVLSVVSRGAFDMDAIPSEPIKATRPSRRK
jgi:hypothetical protein